MKLEVLVVTMNREDFSLADQMVLTGNAVIANQCGRWCYEESKRPYGTLRRIDSDTRGVGVNRNLAILNSSADILLFADDDIKYYDGALEGVADAFRALPDADVIFFGMDMSLNGEVYEHRCDNIRRVHIWNSMKYGTYRIAVRRQAIQKHNIWFSTLFGGGCKYGCGEDSVFICDCFRAGLKLYSHSHVLGSCAKDKSSWFSGYNEKYFFDRGALLACAFKKTKHLIKWYYIWKFSKRTALPLGTMINNINAGIRAFPQLKSYADVQTDKIKGERNEQNA